MTIYMPDISGYEPGINLRGAVAVCAKATEGTGWSNPFYTAQQAEAARAGAFFSAYHFLEGGNGAAQADHAAAHVASKVPLMIDFEPIDPPAGASYPSIADAVAFIRRYRGHGGTCHLLYLPHFYWARGAFGLGGASLAELADLGMVLWSADYVSYTDANSGAGWQSYGGMTPQVWQYTSTMSFGGYTRDIDFSAFRGSKYAGKQDPASVAACLADWRSIASTGKYASAPTPPPPPPTGPVPVPAVRGMSAGHAHNVLAAHHLRPEAPDGQQPTDIVTGTTPAAGITTALTSPVTIAALSADEIAQHATGERVILLQTDLNKAGAHLGVDGDFGQLTLSAVIAFQGQNALRQDGTVGPLTWSALGEL